MEQPHVACWVIGGIVVVGALLTGVVGVLTLTTSTAT